MTNVLVEAGVLGVPTKVEDDTLRPAGGGTCYWLCLADEHVELLASGQCPPEVARQAVVMLAWKGNAG